MQDIHEKIHNDYYIIAKVSQSKLIYILYYNCIIMLIGIIGMICTVLLAITTAKMIGNFTISSSKEDELMDKSFYVYLIIFISFAILFLVKVVKYYWYL